MYFIKNYTLEKVICFSNQNFESIPWSFVFISFEFIGTYDIYLIMNKINETQMKSHQKHIETNIFGRK